MVNPNQRLPIQSSLRLTSGDVFVVEAKSSHQREWSGAMLSVLLCMSFGMTLSPAGEEVMFDLEVIERLAHRLVNDLVDRLRLVVESGNGREDHGAEIIGFGHHL